MVEVSSNKVVVTININDYTHPPKQTFSVWIKNTIMKKKEKKKKHHHVIYISYIIEECTGRLKIRHKKH